MKKLFFASAFFLILFVLSWIKSSPVSAQGTFDCVWNTLGQGSCQVGSNNCDSNSVPDEGVCENYNKNRDRAGCSAAINKDCIPQARTCSTAYQSCSQIPCCSDKNLVCDVTQHCVPSTCSSNGGSCTQSGCGSNQKDIGQLDCRDTWSCCVAATSTIEPTCNHGNGINTAIGCIPINDINAFIGFVLRWAIGIGGGIAFLLIIYAGFMIMTSSGDPERLKAGQELLTSAIAGIIMLIFSVFILRIIGINILGIFK